MRAPEQKPSVSACHQRAVRNAALAAFAAVLALASPVLAGRKQPPKDPPGTSRDTTGQLRDDASGKYAKDPQCETDDDGTAAMRARLRGQLSCAKDQEAHHVVPLKLRNLPMVVRAMKAGWDLNGKSNGLCLSTAVHKGCHAQYTGEVQRRLVADLSTVPPGKLVSQLQSIVDDFKRSLRSRRKPLQ
jgi:hypothetical protein